MPERLHARPEDLERFEQLYRVLENGCWEWVGQRAGAYQAPYFHVGGVTRAARRWIYEVLVEKIEPRRNAIRTCNNYLCVNPEHTKINRKPIQPRTAKHGPRLPKVADMTPLQRMERRARMRARYIKGRGIACTKCGGEVGHPSAKVCRECFGYNRNFRKNPYGEDYLRNRYQFFRAKSEWEKKRSKR